MTGITEDTPRGEDEWRPVTPGMVVAEAPSTLDSRRARSWALVLDSRGVPCCLDNSGSEYQLLVPPLHMERAVQELRLFEASNHEWPPPPLPQREPRQSLLSTLSVLLLLASFHNLSRLDLPLPGMPLADLAELGSANNTDILAGQWWRLITALTLHADWGHLSSNLAIGGLFILLLCRELGPGLAWSLLLVAGSLGNLLNAVFHHGGHNSVGASTAVFGVVGMLSVIGMMRHRQNLRRRWLLPVAAALALLALLGTEGKNTDLGAHFFGFICGGVVGLAEEWLIGRYGRPSLRLDRLLGLLAAICVLTAWLLAVSQG